MFKKIRILVLLFILLTVGQQAWRASNDKNWEQPLYVALYPINADGSAQTQAFLGTLAQNDFIEIQEFLSSEAKRFGLPLDLPFRLRLGSTVAAMPPAPPKAGSTLDIMLWSLHFRWWSWRNEGAENIPADIKLYLLYFDPKQYPTLAHSTALAKGRIGIVNLFGAVQLNKQNAVVIAHELLHTVSATDKYAFTTGFPEFPDGYANPQQSPLHPQSKAELMGGRIAVTSERAEIPKSLASTLIGELTAREIGWVR